jgi:hypothetical protein
VTCAFAHDGQMVFASDILYVWALFWSKLAVCFLVKRLCIARRHVRLANILTYTSAALGFVSLLVIGIRKRIADPQSIAARSTVSTRYGFLCRFLILMPIAAPPMGRCRIVRMHYRPCHCLHAVHAGLGTPDEAKSQSLGNPGLRSPADVCEFRCSFSKLIY